MQKNEMLRFIRHLVAPRFFVSIGRSRQQQAQFLSGVEPRCRISPLLASWLREGVGCAGVPLGIKATILSDSSFLFSINLITSLPLGVNHSFVSRARGFLLGPVKKIRAVFAWFLQLPSQICESSNAVTSESPSSRSSEGAACQFATRFE